MFPDCGGAMLPVCGGAILFAELGAMLFWEDILLLSPDIVPPIGGLVVVMEPEPISPD